MAKKKNVSNSRPVATTSVASTRPSTSANAKSSSTSSLVNNKQASSADSNPQKTQQQQQSATAKIIAKTKAAVESASEQSALDRVTAIKVDAALKRDADKRSAIASDVLIPQFKLTDRQEWALVESARDRYKDEWRHLARHLEHDKADEAGGDDDDDESLKTIVGDQLKINKQTLTIMAHHNYIYRMLEKVGFTRQLIETIMYETLSKSVGDCLDWALMFLDPQQIPSGFTDKHMHYDPKGSLTLVNNNGEAAAVATVSSSTSTSSLDFKSNPPPNNRQQQASSSSSSSMKMAGKSNVDSIDAKLKSWILNQAESDEEEEESQEPAQPTIPTNLNYAQLKLQQEDLKDALKAAKEESGDGGVVLQDINAKLREVKMQMEEVARNKDYNPKTANIEFRRLVEEKNEAAKSKKKKQQQPQQQQQQIDGSGGDLFGDMFSEDATATTSSGRSSSNTTIVIRDMSYTNWTGKSPFQYFRDYLSKQAKGCKITFQNISDGKSGIRLKVTLKGGPKDYDGQTEEMGAEERVGNQKEAEHYACTKLMYKLMKDRPVHRLLPKPYAELWLEFSTAEKLVDKIDKLSEDEERIQFLVKLRNHVLKSIGSSSSKDDSAATTSSLMMDSSSPNNFSAKDKSSMALRSNPTFSQKMLEEYSLRQSNTNYKKLLKTRSQLPVYNSRHHIIQTIQSNQVVIISGDTGSGKSTQIPQFILESEIEANRSSECNIICTQPRRISAVSIATRVSEEMGDPKDVGGDGSWVGYSIRLESKTSRSTKLCFCTTGVLLRQLESDPFLSRVSHIVVDEVHERSLDSDFLLLLLRNVLSKRNGLRIILMSATADAEKFSRYFAQAMCIAGDGSTTMMMMNPLQLCPCVTVPGRTFPVSSYFMEDAVETTGYVLDEDSEFAIRRHTTRDAGFAKVTGKGGNSYRIKLEWEESDNDSSSDEDDQQDSILLQEEQQYSSSTKRTIKNMDHQKLNTDLIHHLIQYICDAAPADDTSGRELGSILVFLPGLGEIKRMYDILSASSRDFACPLLVLPLHSSLGGKEQAQVFLPAPTNTRKVVLSTNIAETGITIPDVVYVIDSCRAREVGYDNRRHITRLKEIFISKANCRQRRGRAGRVKEGICYHLLSKKAFEKLANHQEPEIVRLPLEEVLLRIRASGYKTSFMMFLSDCIDPPPERNVERSIEELIKVQALDSNQDLTALGAKLANIPVDVRLGKMLLYGVALNCLDPILTAAATLSLGKSPFARPFGKETEADHARVAFKVADSDLLTMNNAFDQWREKLLGTGGKEAARNFCFKHYLSYQNLTMIEDARSQLLQLLVGVRVVGRDVIHRDRNKGLIQSTISAKYSGISSHAIVSAAICAGLYPNLLQAVIDDQTETINSPAQKTFQLRPPGSREIVKPHHAKSAFAGSGPDLKRPLWFAYHLMTRVGGGGGGGGGNVAAKLKVWDVNRVGFFPVVTFAGSTTKVEHRHRYLGMENGTIKIRLPPRSAVALELFTTHIRNILEKRMFGELSITPKEDSALKLYLQLLEEEWKSFEF